MLNKIWFWLLCIGILYGFCKAAYQTKYPPATPPQAAESTAPADEKAKPPQICIPLIGTMALWLGLLNVAKDAGLIDAFARVMRPIMRWLFPEVPDGHPAQGAMLMNFAANMIGLDNAATPLGLKAMEELQTLNPVKDTATNSMAQFLAINCGSITLIPFTIISFRYISGSKDPAGIIGGTLIASTASVIAGVTAARLLSRRYPMQAETVPSNAGEPA
jgi:spore maturation protein A